MIEFIKGLPKAELHLHIEGTLEPELMFTLADRNKIKLPFKSIEQVKEAYQFEDLQSFLDIYYEGANVLQREQDFFDLTWAYLLKAKNDAVEHCEIFFDPQTHTQRGVPFSVAINGIHQALVKGQKELGISFQLINSFLRHLSEKEAIETFTEAQKHKDKIFAVGLDSSEKGNPPSKFNNVFKLAKSAGFKCVAHAGEEGSADYIWEAIKILEVDRIDHGVMATKDKILIEHLKAERTPLTVCPLSNVKLKVFQTLQEHNIKRMLDHNLCVTINSDDPAYFGGYINENFIQTQQSLQLSKQQLIQLAKNSFEASFISSNQKSAFFEKINQYVTKNEQPQELFNGTQKTSRNP